MRMPARLHTTGPSRSGPRTGLPCEVTRRARAGGVRRSSTDEPGTRVDGQEARDPGSLGLLEQGQAVFELTQDPRVGDEAVFELVEGRPSLSHVGSHAGREPGLEPVEGPPFVPEVGREPKGPADHQQYQ